MKKSSALFDVVVEKYRKGQVMIGFNRSSLLADYAKVTKNPLVKLFHHFVWLYSFPVTIVAVAAVFFYLHQYAYIALYAAGLGALLALERYVSQRVTLCQALSNPEAFSRLLKSGVITVRDTAEPDSLL